MLPGVQCSIDKVETGDGDLIIAETTNLSDTLLSYSPPTHYSTGVPPLLPDPFEENTVRVKPSQIPGAGEGLFATRDIGDGELVAFYSGFINTCKSCYNHMELDRRVDNADKIKINMNLQTYVLEWF